MRAMRTVPGVPPRWHTAGVHPTQRRRGSAARRPRVLARWVLLGAVIAGVFALHVLTAENGPGGHTGVPAVATSTHLPTAGPSLAVPVSESDQATGVGAGVFWLTAPGSDTGHPGGTGPGEGLLLGCILFLVVVGPLALVLLLRRRRGATEDVRLVPVGWGSTGHRIPARPGVPRLALCVIRI